MKHRIAPVEGPAEIETVRLLFREYADGLAIDLGFQEFEGELATLPGRYAPPRGALLVARDDAGQALGCVALRPLDRDSVCEIKRLYVRAAARKTGLGRALAETILECAVALSYRRAVLDTLSTMDAATALYRSLGFTETVPYGPPPVVPDMLFFERRLDAG